MVPPDDQTKWPDLNHFTSEHFLGSLERERFNWCLEILLSFGKFPWLFLLLPFPTMSCQGLPTVALFISADSRGGRVVCFQAHMKFVLKVKLPLTAHKMIDFSFLLPEVKAGRSAFIRPHGRFLPPTLLPLLCKKSVSPCSDLHQVRHNSGRLCMFISLNRVDGEMFESRAAVGCFKTSALLVCFLNVNFLPEDLALLLRQPLPPSYKNT